MILDVDLELARVRRDGTEGHVRVRGSGTELVVELAGGPGGQGGAGIDWSGVRALADLLASRGLTLHVERGGRRVISLGAVERAALWRLTGAPPLRLGRTRDLAGAGLELAGSRLVRPLRRPPVRGGAGAPQRAPDGAPVVIGSHPSCDLVLTGLKPRHAVLARDVEGRTVLKALAGRCYVDGSPVVSQVVDADSDIRLGEHRVTLGQVASGV